MKRLALFLCLLALLFSACTAKGDALSMPEAEARIEKSLSHAVRADDDFVVGSVGTPEYLSDSAVYDIGDAVLGRVSPDKAIVKDSRNEGIHFIAAPYNFSNRMSKLAFSQTVKSFAASGDYDYIFIDTPGGIGEPLEFAASVADIAYIRVAPTSAAIRAAERTGIFLSEAGVSRQRLIINKLSGRSVKKAKEEVISFIDETAVKLIGVVPYDTEMIRAGNAGKLVDEIFSNNISHAFENIALRTMGKTCPLFHNIQKLKKLR